ncbi:MAG TPA: Gfo/Idh/MocA family oxidoreductase [Elusimicrobiota bacterium]|nr:Gfo/Idh/MocA family oxidoreductase [Elusimicrobiota bacterium]
MLTVGLIGYGYWGPNLARVFSELPDVSLHTLCDRSFERQRLARSRFHRLSTCTNPDELFRNPDIDAVLIATPVSTHAQLATQALKAGKHVYVEKPMSMRPEDAEHLTALAKRQRRILMVGHTFLYSPPVRKIKQMIDQQTLGRIYYINCSRVNLGLFQPDVSVFYDLAPHDISMILYWLNADPLWVCAEGASFVRKKILEVGFATMGFPRGVVAHLHVSWLAPSKLRQTTVVGSKRMILYDDTSNNEKVKLFDQGVVRNPETFGEFQLTYRSGDVLSPHIDASEPLRNQAKAFVEAIESGRPPISDARFGGRVVRVLDAIEASSRQNGKRRWLR